MIVIEDLKSSKPRSFIFILSISIVPLVGSNILKIASVKVVLPAPVLPILINLKINLIIY